MHYVYIIYSKEKELYYKGESANVKERIVAHNHGDSVYTKDKGPWTLVYVEKFESRVEALKRERQVKRFNNRSLQKLFLSATNIVHQFH